MTREQEHDDLIDLGAASVETKGTPVGGPDLRGGLIPAAGLNDE